MITPSAPPPYSASAGVSVPPPAYGSGFTVLPVQPQMQPQMQPQPVAMGGMGGAPMYVPPAYGSAAYGNAANAPPPAYSVLPPPSGAN